MVTELNFWADAFLTAIGSPSPKEAEKAKKIIGVIFENYIQLFS
jgi:hypothetical protein